MGIFHVLPIFLTLFCDTQSQVPETGIETGDLTYLPHCRQSRWPKGRQDEDFGDEIGFLFFGHDRKIATQAVLSAVRMWYPKAKFLLVEFGTHQLEELAIGVGATYWQSRNLIKLGPRDERYAYLHTSNDLKSWLTMWKESLVHLSRPWVIYLEPDSLLRWPIGCLPSPEASLGASLHDLNVLSWDDSSNWPMRELILQVNAKYADNNDLHVAGFGGTIINTLNFNRALDNALHVYWPNLSKLYERHVMYYADVTLSLIVYLSDGIIEDWWDLTERAFETNPYLGATAALVHDFKYFYSEDNLLKVSLQNNVDVSSVSFVMWADNSETLQKQITARSIRQWYPDSAFHIVEFRTNLFRKLADTWGAVYWQYDDESVSSWLRAWQANLEALTTSWVITVGEDVLIRRRIFSLPSTEVTLAGEVLWDSLSLTETISGVAALFKAGRSRYATENTYLMTSDSGIIVNREKMLAAMRPSTGICWRFFDNPVTPDVPFSRIAVLLLFVYMRNGTIEDWPELATYGYTEDMYRHLTAAIMSNFTY